MQQEKFIPNAILRQVGYIIIFLLLAGVIIYNMSVFLPGVLGAICLYMLLIHPLRWLHIKKRWDKFLATIILMIFIASIVFFPIYLLINLLTQKFSVIFNQKSQIKQTITDAIARIHETLGINILDEKYLTKATEFGAQTIQGIINTTLDSVIQLLIALFILFFMLINYKELEQWFYKNIPLKKENLTTLNKKVRELIISNAVGVPLVALLQATVAYIGFIFIDLPDAFSWYILMIFSGMIPVIGTALVYIPAVIFLIANGDTNQGYILLAYCFFIVGAVDNIFRFLLQKKIADVHPLITVFGVIVGINLFGFIGIIFGPILFSLLFWMFNLYKLEFISKKTSITKNYL